MGKTRNRISKQSSKWTSFIFKVLFGSDVRTVAGNEHGNKFRSHTIIPRAHAMLFHEHGTIFRSHEILIRGRNAIPWIRKYIRFARNNIPRGPNTIPWTRKSIPFARNTNLHGRNAIPWIRTNIQFARTNIPCERGHFCMNCNFIQMTDETIQK